MGFKTNILIIYTVTIYKIDVLSLQIAIYFFIFTRKNIYMKFKICFLSIICLFSYQIKAQDSLRSNDPQPVIITQEGYTPSQNQEAQSVKDLSFKQRLRLGGGISQIQFGNPTVIGVSPMLAYLTSDKSLLAVGGSYNYLRVKDPFSGQKFRGDFASTNILYRHEISFLQQLIGQAFAQLEAEQYFGITNKNDKYRPSLMAGIGIGMRRGIGFTVLYDFNYKNTGNGPYSPTNSPFVVRSNFFF